MALTPGTRFGVYEIVGLIGSGGMGEVYRAHDTRLGRAVAIKIVMSATSADARARVLREGRAAAALNHPNICTVLEVSDSGDRPFIVMELVDGPRMSEIVGDRVGLDTLVRYGIQITDGLAHAHDRGIVHRDLKSANLAVASDGRVKILDFGIAGRMPAAPGATMSPTITDAAVIAGTPAYMAPELLRGAPADRRSDIWSLGVVLYELASGRRPFKGDTSYELTSAILREEPPALSDLTPQIRALIHRCLFKDPSSRYQQAAEIRAALEVIAGGAGDAGRASSRTVPFVAVLPFDNLSSDPENEYFSDGITEDIIARLSKIRALRVISRTSAMRYKKAHKDVRQIGAELGVTHVIEGSVRQAGNRLRIVAQLIDARTDEHLWADTFNRDNTDVFAIQTDVAERIADTLEARMSSAERSQVAKKPTTSLKAYDLFLLGRHHYSKVGPDEFRRALDYFRRAVDEDANFADAYATLAVAEHYIACGYFGVRPHDVYPEAIRHASRAIELDPGNALGRACLAGCDVWYRFDWSSAEANFARAIELNPNDAMTRIYYGIHLAALGRDDEAVDQCQIASQLDPVAMIVCANANFILYLCGQCERARRDAEELRTLDPASPWPTWCLSLASLAIGDVDEGARAMEECARLTGNVTFWLLYLASGLAAAGRRERAREILREIHDRERSEYVWPQGVAMAYAQLGETDMALDWLQRAYDDRVGYMFCAVSREPLLRPLHGNPRYEAIRRAIRPSF